MRWFPEITPRLSALLFSALTLTSTTFAEEEKRSQPTIYPVGNRFVHLGGPEKYEREWKGVEAPQSVFDAARRILKGNPAKWDVSLFLNVPTPGKQVVFLKDGKNNQLVYWVKRDRWIRLNEKGSVSTLNEVTKEMRGRRILRANMTEVMLYVQEVAALYRGRCRALLYYDFLNEAGGAKSDGGKPWVTGTEKNPEAFYKLFHDPIITKKGANVSVKFNMLVFGGSVEEWTLKGTYDHGMILRDIDVQELRKPGTFFSDCY